MSPEKIINALIAALFALFALIVLAVWGSPEVRALVVLVALLSCAAHFVAQDGRRPALVASIALNYGAFIAGAVALYRFAF